MRIFSSHRLRGQTVNAAQRVHMESPPDTEGVQARMADVFDGYLDKKRPEQLLKKAQALLQHHPCNRTRPEQVNFTTGLFAACAHRDVRIAAAVPLAHLCHIAQSMARDQAIVDCSSSKDPIDLVTLEQSYREIFERQRVPEALTFYFARMLPVASMHDHVAFLTDPAVLAARKHIVDLLQDTPESHPIGIDLVGRSLQNSDLTNSPAGPLEGVRPEIEKKVRALCDATWSPAISLAGMLALCHGLEESELDLLLAFCASDGHQAFLQVCERFTAALPEVYQPAIEWGLTEAFRDHLPSKKGRS